MCENLDLGLDTNEPDLPLAGMNRDIYIYPSKDLNLFNLIQGRDCVWYLSVSIPSTRLSYGTYGDSGGGGVLLPPVVWAGQLR